MLFNCVNGKCQIRDPAKYEGAKEKMEMVDGVIWEKGY